MCLWVGGGGGGEQEKEREREKERDGRMVYCIIKLMNHINVVGEHD